MAEEHLKLYYRDGGNTFYFAKSLKDGNYSPDLRDNKDGMLHDVFQKYPEFTVLGVDFDTKLLLDELGRVITLVLMDSSGDVFRAKTSTGVTGILDNEDQGRIEPGCTLVVHKYKWIRLSPDPTHRGFMFIEGAKWLKAPTEEDFDSCFKTPMAMRRITETDLESVGSNFSEDTELVEVWCDYNYIDKELITVCFEHSLILETRYGSDPDPASMDGRKSMIHSSVITYNDHFFINLYCYRNEANAHKRRKMDNKENVSRIPSSCRCVNEHGYAKCLGTTIPTKTVNKKHLYYEIGHKYREHKKSRGAKKSTGFDALTPCRQQLCLYWWYGINFFEEDWLNNDAPKLDPPLHIGLH